MSSCVTSLSLQKAFKLQLFFFIRLTVLLFCLFAFIVNPATWLIWPEIFRYTCFFSCTKTFKRTVCFAYAQRHAKLVQLLNSKNFVKYVLFSLITASATRWRFHFHSSKLFCWSMQAYVSLLCMEPFTGHLKLWAVLCCCSQFVSLHTHILIVVHSLLINLQIWWRKC
jgi:hypothetical protein